ncbi:MAG: hypothetical protein PHE79_10320 [Eubacteriales bacterium]|nr:hypothetical protein [Eubacteriales bacterium]
MMKNIKKVAEKTALAACLLAMSYSNVFAVDADAFWNSTTGFIFSWVTRIGFLIGVFGIVQIGVSFASDNPDSRVRGVQFFVAGCIIFAVGLSPNFITF